MVKFQDEVKLMAEITDFSLEKFKAEIINHALPPSKEKLQPQPMFLMVIGAYGIGKTPMAQMLMDKDIVPADSVRIGPRLVIPFNQYYDICFFVC